MRLKGSPLSICFGAVKLFSIFFVFKGSPFDFIEVRARNIRSKTLYLNYFAFLYGGGGGPKTGVFHENVLRIFQISAF